MGYKPLLVFFTNSQLKRILVNVEIPKDFDSYGVDSKSYW